MGLAASQARLLTITARKADCEFQSMTFSHQKLALSRDMERISDEYQNALNLTKLVYDYQGTGDSTMALTYDLLMTPSIYNEYYPRLLTDSNNRCILNATYAAAARAAGIPAEGLSGTPSSDIRNKFIQALASNGEITAATAASIQSVTYGNTLGLGSTISTTVGFDELTYDQLLDRIKALGNTGTDTYGINFGANGIEYKTSKCTNECNPTTDPCKKNNKDGGHWTFEDVYVNNTKITTGEDQSTRFSYNITLSQLLNNDDVTLYWKTNQSELTPIYETAALQNLLAGPNGFLDWMLDQFSTVLGGSVENQLALQYAYNQLYDLICPNNDLQDLAYDIENNPKVNGNKSTDLDNWTQWRDEKSNGVSIEHMRRIQDTMNAIGSKVAGSDDYSYNDVGAKADSYLGFVFSAGSKIGNLFDWRDDGKVHQAVGINLNNLAQAFLTSYVQYSEGDSSKYYWDKGLKTLSNMFDPKKDNFIFNVIAETDVNTGDSDLYASFYDTLFNRICVNGWTMNEQIDDKDYMAEMLKNGMAFISSISDDGFYYQNQYSSDIFIREVSDTEAIAKAQAKYNTEKAKIENKEDTIDIKMKNLETEISALTTEYDTAKALITKSIEKSFKRYEA